MITIFGFALQKRTVISVLVALLVAAAFWSGSRYPELDAKAAMGGDAQLEDPLSFDAVYPVQAASPLWERVAFTTINWLHTNRRGMAFGIALGAILLTLLNSLPRKGVSNALHNTVMGIVIGAPLGLCVNCAAPVAKGLHHSGARLETTLAAMMSAPTLNVVVLTMLFTMFPPYMAIAKLAGSLVFILIVIPVMSRHVFHEELETTIENSACAVEQLPLGSATASEGWGEALRVTTVELAKNLYFLVRTTVPLMLLAGFLGALAISVLPLEYIATIGSGLPTMVLLSLAGILLPLPMAFDIVVCAALMAAGMQPSYVMVLLFTMGIFSVYSFFILYTTISRRVAFGLMGVLVVMGILIGLGAGQYHAWQVDRMLDYYREHSSASTSTMSPEDTRVAEDLATGEQRPRTARSRLDASSHPIGVTSRPFRPRSATDGKTGFVRYEGREYGLHRPILFSGRDFWAPFLHGRGIASGDFNNDGMIDLALATSRGVLLFANREGRFDSVPFGDAESEQLDAFAVALVDINDDGWLDLYFTAWDDGNYYVLNQSGSFSSSRLHRIQNRPAVHTESLSFGDFDEDGDLDAVLGNFFFGNGGLRPVSDDAANRLLINHAGEFSDRHSRVLPGMPGETLSVLFTDFNRDHHLDLIVGNDWSKPDYYYIGDGRGSLRLLGRSDGVIPRSTWTTMSVDTGDVDNDLEPDIYLAQIAAMANRTNRTPVRPFSEYCDEILNKEDQEICLRNIELRQAFQLWPTQSPMAIEKCETIADKYEGERETCMAMWMMQAAYAEKRPALCDEIVAAQPRAARLCRNRFKRGPVRPREEWADVIAQVRNRNVLLVRNPSGRFADEAESRGVTDAHWAWNAKFADLDNDEWQDIYVVNGSWWSVGKGTGVPTNLFFENQGGTSFLERTREYGLEDFVAVSAYTYLDIDNDGDLDIISNAVNAPIRVYENQLNRNHSIAFRLRDHVGNRFGIGSKIILHYGEKGQRHQVRELKAGGGFLSFDAPVAYFGLGSYMDVSRVEIIWSTGGMSVISEPLVAGALYTITRGSD